MVATSEMTAWHQGHFRVECATVPARIPKGNKQSPVAVTIDVFKNFLLLKSVAISSFPFIRKKLFFLKSKTGASVKIFFIFFAKTPTF